MSHSFPPIPEVLLTELEKLFPATYPDLKQPDRELYAKAGEGRVIEFLRRKFDEQNKGRLKRSP